MGSATAFKRAAAVRRLAAGIGRVKGVESNSAVEREID